MTRVVSASTLNMRLPSAAPFAHADPCSTSRFLVTDPCGTSEFGSYGFFAATAIHRLRFRLDVLRIDPFWTLETVTCGISKSRSSNFGLHVRVPGKDDPWFLQHVVTRSGTYAHPFLVAANTRIFFHFAQIKLGNLTVVRSSLYMVYFTCKASGLFVYGLKLESENLIIPTIIGSEQSYKVVSKACGCNP